MPQKYEKNEPNELSRRKVRDHMANERTFLAWIRTSVAIMAFGFILEKFSLFLKQMASILGHARGITQIPITTPKAGFSAVFGIILVGIGAIICVLAIIKYKQINTNTFKPTIIIDYMLSATIFSIGVFLTLYLLSTIL